MSGAADAGIAERALVLRRIRDALRELASEGVAYVGRGSAPPRAASPKPSAAGEVRPTRASSGFQPRVAPLAPRAELSPEATAKARELAEQITDSLQSEQARIREEKRGLARQVQEIRDRARREAGALLRDTERRGKKLLKGVRHEGESARPRLREAVREMEEEVVRRVPPPPRRRGGGPVGMGDRVQIISLGANS